MFEAVSTPQSLPAEPPRPALPLGDWLALGWRLKGWMVLGALAGGLAAILASQLLTPSYRANAQIFIDPQNLQVLERDLSPSTAAGDAGVVLIESQARVMASDAVLRAAAARLGLDGDPEFVRPLNPLRALLEGALTPASDAPRDDLGRAVLALGKAVHVVRLDRTYVIDVHAESESATKAAAIANGVVEAYLALRESQRAEQAGRASAALGGRLAQLLARLEAAENAVETFRTGKGIVETGGRPLIETRVGQTDAALLAARNGVEAASIQLRQLQALAADPERIIAAPEALGSPEMTRLRAEWQTAAADAAILGATLGARHPRRIVAEERIATIRAAIRGEIGRLVTAAELALQRARDSEAALSAQMRTATAQLQDDDASRIRLRQLEREAEASRAVYEDALLRSRETAEQAAVDTINAQVVSPAVPPLERNFPPRLSLMLPLGLIAGLCAGAGLGWLRLGRGRRA